MKSYLIFFIGLFGCFNLIGQSTQDCLQQLNDQKERLDQVVDFMACRYQKIDPPQIGQIVASYLDYRHFSAVSGQNEAFNSATSKWAPADGRNVSGSVYAFVVSRSNNAPDLRGVFLRGLNAMDPERSTLDLVPERADPQVRNVGEFQMDTFQDHTLSYTLGTANGPNPNVMRPGVGEFLGKLKAQSAGEPRVGLETRPKNIAIYYYIRIN